MSMFNDVIEESRVIMAIGREWNKYDLREWPIHVRGIPESHTGISG